MKKMEKQEKRTEIQLLFLKGLTPTEIKIELDGTLGEDSPSFSSVKKWCAMFRKGEMRIVDAPRSGCRRSARNEETIDKVRQIVNADCRAKLTEIAKKAEISKGSAFKIVHKELKMSNQSGRWVPCLLDQHQSSNESQLQNDTEDT